MATRMQQRRGTASQWTSTNAGAGPVLNAGEIGWESDTNRFKIGDGVNNWSNLDYFADINSTANPSFGTSITFEGATADSYETTLQVTDPTADRTITIPNVDGTIITTGNLSDITDIGVFSSTITMEGSTSDAFELTLSAGDPTADRTITFPDATGTVQLRVADVSDAEIGYLNGVTSAIQTQLDNKSTASKTETLTNKTLTSPVISTIVNSGTLTLPTSTGTIALTTDIPAGVVTESGTQTLTNKTLTSPKINEDVAVTATATELNYVDGVTSAIQTQLNDKAPLAGPALTGDATAVNLTISGNLTVNGTTTNLNSTNLVIEDKNIILADVETPTDTTADGGGITLKGATDKTFNWIDSTDSWTSSEHINLASGKSYYMNGTLLKDVSETLTNKTLSSAILTGSLTAGGGTGTSGQVLKSTGSGVEWTTPSGGAAFSEFMLIGA